ncbi:hypothetical protein LOZ61_003191, partial [Ophidiomyces ophidiicola]
PDRRPGLRLRPLRPPPPPRQRPRRARHPGAARLLPLPRRRARAHHLLGPHPPGLPGPAGAPPRRPRPPAPAARRRRRRPRLPARLQHRCRRRRRCRRERRLRPRPARAARLLRARPHQLGVRLPLARRRARRLPRPPQGPPPHGPGHPRPLLRHPAPSRRLLVVAGLERPAARGHLPLARRRLAPAAAVARAHHRPGRQAGRHPI